MPVSGTWRASFDLTSLVHSGENNRVAIYRNDKKLYRTDHGSSSTYKDSGLVRFSGGRHTFLEAKVGDTLYLKVTSMDGSYWYINFCVLFVPKM